MLSLRCCAQVPSRGCDRGPLLTAVRGPPTAVASPSAERGLQVRGPQQLWCPGSVVVACRPQRAGQAAVAHGPSCSAACGILPDQGSNLGPLHWQADSQPLPHQGSPTNHFYFYLQVFFFLCCFPHLSVYSVPVF